MPPRAAAILKTEMPDLPDDLARLGDALENAVSGAMRRRREQLRAAGALAAVVAAVPMALAAAHLHLSHGDGRVPAGLTPAAQTPQPAAPRVSHQAARARAA